MKISRLLLECKQIHNYEGPVKIDILVKKIGRDKNLWIFVKRPRSSYACHSTINGNTFVSKFWSTYGEKFIQPLSAHFHFISPHIR
jgi:hypothetical protein